MASAPIASAMTWTAHDRPSIEAIACSWLLARFVDPRRRMRSMAPPASIGPAALSSDARRRRAGDAACRFDALLDHHRLCDPALDLLAVIVRSIATGRTDLAPQSAGLLAIAFGLGRSCRDPDEVQRLGFAVYDALYEWCRMAPPGPDFAATRCVPAGGLRRAWQRRRERTRMTRVLDALNRATLRAIGSLPPKPGEPA